MKQTVINMEGKEFNNLKVIRRNGSDNKGKALWDVKCHCGNIFTTSGASIRSGGTKSCGCSRLKSAKKWVKIIKLMEKLVVNSIQSGTV